MRRRRKSSLQTGSHYTSFANWQKIAREGLVPYLIDKPELYAVLGVTSVTGIWIWEDDLTEIEELGSLIYQLAYKAETTIVKLRVLYSWDDILRKGDRDVHLTHSGNIQNWIYHGGDLGARILTNPVPTHNIELLRTFDLLDIVR
jgi:hypothetical protein